MATLNEKLPQGKSYAIAQTNQPKNGISKNLRLEVEAFQTGE
jgi:hypothetical protein